jgi:hypothetical protein
VHSIAYLAGDDACSDPRPQLLGDIEPSLLLERPRIS